MRQNLALTFILLTVVIDAIGIGLIFPVMPDLMTEVTGQSLSDAALWGGVLATAFAVMQFLCGPVVGNLSDRFGRRPVLLTSLAVMALDYVVMAVAHSVWLLLIGRIVAGIAAATHGTANAYFGVGFVAGPMLGGLLAVVDSRAPFWAAAALAGANFLFGLIALPESLSPALRRPLTMARANPLGAFAAIRKLPGLKLLLTVSFIYAVTFNVWPSIWAYYGKAAFGWDARWIGISLAVFGIFMALAQATLMQPMVSRFGERRTALYGMGTEIGTYGFYAFVTSGFWALVFTPVSAFGGVTGPALQSMMSRATPEDQQGELQGINASLNALATILAPLIMTAVFGHFTRTGAAIYWPGAPFLVSALLMMAGTALFIFGRKND